MFGVFQLMAHTIHRPESCVCHLFASALACPPSRSSQGWMSRWGTSSFVLQARVEQAVSICLLLGQARKQASKSSIDRIAACVRNLIVFALCLGILSCPLSCLTEKVENEFITGVRIKIVDNNCPQSQYSKQASKVWMKKVTILSHDQRTHRILSVHGIPFSYDYLSLTSFLPSFLPELTSSSEAQKQNRLHPFRAQPRVDRAK